MTLLLPIRRERMTLTMTLHPAEYEESQQPMRRLGHHPDVISRKEAAAHEAQEDLSIAMSLYQMTVGPGIASVHTDTNLNVVVTVQDLIDDRET